MNNKKYDNRLSIPANSNSLAAQTQGESMNFKTKLLSPTNQRPPKTVAFGDCGAL